MANNVQLAIPSSTSKPWQGLPLRRQITISQDQVRTLEQSGLVKQASSLYAKWDANVTNEKDKIWRVSLVALIPTTSL